MEKFDVIVVGAGPSGNAAAYTMVKKNWFNGVDMPSIIIKKLDGTIAIQRCFDYEDYKNSLS